MYVILGVVRIYLVQRPKDIIKCLKIEHIMGQLGVIKKMDW